MSAHTNSPEASAAIQALAKRIEEYRTHKHWTQVRLLREFPGLGSSKVYWACQEGKTEELDLDDVWLPQYRAVIALIEAEISEPATDEQLYDDLIPVSELGRVVGPLFKTTSNDRVVIYLGEPGSGKSTAADIIAKSYPRMIVKIEAVEAWGDKPAPLLCAILKKFGNETFKSGATAQLNDVLAIMNGNRRVMFIDEAHHLGPRQLNVIKTLVNQSTWGFVLLCMPTLWRKLEKTAYEESRQLTTNRLAEVVRISAPTERDVQRVVSRRVPGMKKEMEHLAVKMIAKSAVTCGAFGFVRDVCTRLRDQGSAAELTREDVAQSVDKELISRGRQACDIKAV
jgi:DNA transposition AAA+ family ATPase